MAIESLERVWTAEETFPPKFGAASDYARKMSRRPLKYFEDRIHNAGLAGDRVLDAGCGTGTWSFALLSTFAEVHGIDFVTERANYCAFVAEQHGLSDRARFRQGDVMATGFPDACFDAVWCFGVIIAPQTDLAKSLAEFKRVVRPGGEIFVCVNGPGWAYYLASADAPARSAQGRKGIYAALRDTRLAGLPEAIRTLPEETRRQALAEEGSAGDRLAALARIADIPAIAETASRLAADCGDTYVDDLWNEASVLLSGREPTFKKLSGYPQNYEPAEVENLAKGLGLADFRWDLEGRLIRATEPRTVRPIYAGTFGDRIANWEFVVRRD